MAWPHGFAGQRGDPDIGPQRQALSESYSLFSQWTEAIGEDYDANPLFEPMIDAASDLENSIFNALHG